MLPQTSQFGLRLRNQLGAPGVTGAAKSAGILIGGALVAGIGGALYGVGKLIQTSIGNAADLGESINKATVIFDKDRKEVLKWSKATSGAMGIARSDALEAAGGFGAMFESAGFVRGEIAPMSTEMVQLAADMASFNNQDPAEMLVKLRAGLAGEAEPLRQFGVFLSEAAIQTQALKDGIVEQGAEMTDAQKIQARYNLIMKETAKQQGDFARTSGSLPNIQRRISAGWTDITATLGKAFLPIMEDLGKEIAKFIASDEFQAWLKDAVKWIKEVVANIGDWVQESWPAFRDAAVGAIKTIQAFWAEFGDEIMAVAKFIFGVVLKRIIIEIGTVITIFKVLSKVPELVGKGFEFLKRITGDVLGFLLSGWRNFLSFWIGVAGGIVDAGATAFGWLPVIGDDVKEAQAKFHQMTDGVLSDLDKQINSFHSWGEASQGEISRTSAKMAALTSTIKAQTGLSNIQINANIAGDGPGRISGGSAVGWAQQAIAAVAGPQMITSTYRSPAHNASVGGSPTSYHMDRSNPAADIAGSNLAGIYSYLTRFPVRELLDEGDHIHVARYGMHTDVSKPTHILAGEAGPERVDITPHGKRGRAYRISGTMRIVDLASGVVQIVDGRLLELG